MWTLTVAVLAISAVASALPAKDPVLGTWSEGIRYDYIEDDEGKLHLVDNWLKASDYNEFARYNPDVTNEYHLFTRSNPTLSQPLVLNMADTVRNSNFNWNRRTVVLMHGFAGSVTSTFNAVLLPAYLAAEDCNVIILDWSDGAIWGPRAIQAGQAAGRFINWLNSLTGASARDYHIAGYSVGGHGAGIIARNIGGDVGFVLGLDPAERWDSQWNFRPDDGSYSEVIHTNTDDIGYPNPLGQVDFYPNGGGSQPGCITNWCSHDRSFHYQAEALSRGGFTARRCDNLEQAKAGECTGATLRMGGIAPKLGNSGIYYLPTSWREPFSQG